MANNNPNAIQYTNVPEGDFSNGIDVRSGENQRSQGFVKDLLNGDVIEKKVKKRVGYQGFGGNVPIRAAQMDYDQTNGRVIFSLPGDSTISLDSLTSSPLVVYGLSSVFTAGQGPFSTTASTAKYYTGFSLPTGKTLLAPGGTLLVPGTEHALPSSQLFTSIVESTSLSNRSYTQVDTNSVLINKTSFDINIGYTTSVDEKVFVYYSNQAPSVGLSYVATIVHTGAPVSQSFTVTAGTHALDSFNIVAQLQQDTGTTVSQVTPDSLLLLNNGDVTVTISNGTGSSQTYYLILSAAPAANVTSGIVAASSTGTVSLSGVTKPWIFSSIYLEQTPGGTKELVLPDSITYDDTTQLLTMSFDNAASSARNFIIFYQYGTTRSNQLYVTDTVTTTGSDTAPQITIWGISQDEIYTTKELREGWVNHIDSYRRSGEQRVVCGLGGNLFTARSYPEAASTYAYPLLYPSLVARTSGSSILGPLFWDSGETPGRTRGYITSDASGSNWATVSAVQYDSNTGWTKYTINLPNKSILDQTGSVTTLGAVISTTASLEDWLSVQQMSYKMHEGTFRIRQVQDGTNQIIVWVENPLNSSDYDDSGTAGEAGVFTDQLTWIASSPFIPADGLTSDSITAPTVLTALSSLGTVTVINELLGALSVPGGVVFTGSRTSAVIPLRTGYPLSVSSVTNLVNGDMLSYSPIPRLLRVLSVNPDTDRTISITATGGVATVVLGSGDTTALAVGRRILITQGEVYTGTHTVEAILSTTSFSFLTDETDSVAGATLVGCTAELDEELSWADSFGDANYFRCEQRWIPTEAPVHTYDQPAHTHVKYFDSAPYTNQSFLRSTIVTDNLYLTNGSDTVQKFDGTSLYRAGLIPWQPGLFVTQETTGATIVTSLRHVAYSAILAAQGKLTITAATQEVLPVGTKVQLSGSAQQYTVTSYTQDDPTTPTAFYLLLDRALDSNVSATGNANEIGVFRYYFRLNAVDSNNNVVASAVTGYQDHVVELTQNAAVLLKLVGLPNWDVYDFIRLECQIYRTKMNLPAPFYLVTTLPMSFNNTAGYLQFRDSFADDDLTDLDVASTVLKAAELGTGWSDPLRAKYVTSIGNRLVLGNVRDYPQLDIQIVSTADLSNSTLANSTFLFRKDNTDSGTISDMVNRVTYQFVNGFSGNAGTYTQAADQFSFVTSIATGAAAGDWIYLTYATVGTTNRDLTYSGWWQIASVVGTTVTVNLTGAAAATSYPDKYVIATSTSNVPVLLGTDGNLGMVNGALFNTFDSMRRLSMAINSTMRMVDTSLAGYETYTPWMVSRGGNDTAPAGRLLVRQPNSSSQTISVTPTFSGYNLFINASKHTSGVENNASTRIYPSRILVSYQNFPEIMDNPTAVLDSQSDSVIDINSADGQEITGIIPFFGEAAFTAAQQSAILVVFKTNSIYLVDINQKVAGQNPVQRLQTEGLGCTAPYSIAVNKSGITFANEGGVYCLRQSQTIDYIGRFMERNWLEKVDTNALDVMQGTHFAGGRSYKLSVPILSTESGNGYVENSEVYVYNHTSEGTYASGSYIPSQLGAWSRYDNHMATGWANLGSDAFFGSSGGRVFSLRRTNSYSDYRDDNATISFMLQTQPNSFGNQGIRKILDSVLVHYRTLRTSTGTSVQYSVDFDQEYQATTAFRISGPSTTSTGMSDAVNKDIVTIRHKIANRRGNFFSIQVTNLGFDEAIEISGLEYKVAGLTEKGITSAGST